VKEIACSTSVLGPDSLGSVTGTFGLSASVTNLLQIRIRIPPLFQHHRVNKCIEVFFKEIIKRSDADPNPHSVWPLDPDPGFGMRIQIQHLKFLG
jgi:hypothetical protein